MSDLSKHAATLDDASKAYAEATHSSVRFLIVENECMAKVLQMAKKGEEQDTTSTIIELKK